MTNMIPIISLYRLFRPWSPSVTGQEHVGWSQLNLVAVFKVYSVGCSVFLLCVGLSHKHTSPMLVWLAQKDSHTFFQGRPFTGPVDQLNSLSKTKATLWSLLRSVFFTTAVVTPCTLFPGHHKNIAYVHLLRVFFHCRVLVIGHSMILLSRQLKETPVDKSTWFCGYMLLFGICSSFVRLVKNKNVPCLYCTCRTKHR